MAGKFGGKQAKPFGVKETKAEERKDAKAGVKPGSAKDNRMDRKGK